MRLSGRSALAGKRLTSAAPASTTTATFGVKQAAAVQCDTRLRFGGGRVQNMQQFGRKRAGQLRLTLVFLFVERQLQHAAIVPVDAAFQTFQQPTGVTKAAEDQLRKRGAVGGQLQVEHALRIAGCLLRKVRMPLQQTDLPTAGGQTGRGCAAGEPGTNDQR
nr:hypothetical protein [Tanacetum cinerariifolium]